MTFLDWVFALEPVAWKLLVAWTILHYWWHYDRERSNV